MVPNVLFSRVQFVLGGLLRVRRDKCKNRRTPCELDELQTKRHHAEAPTLADSLEPGSVSGYIDVNERKYKGKGGEA